MKGVIASCLKDLVITKFGKDKWSDILTGSGLNPNMSIMANQDIDDEVILNVVKSTCNTLGISLQQAADAFGDHWVNVFAKKVYFAYYMRPKTAKEFLLNMDAIHQKVTQTVPNAKPPRFTYDWRNEKVLIMTYKSKRGLIDFVVGLAKGVGKYYKEELSIRKIATDKIEITFP